MRRWGTSNRGWGHRSSLGRLWPGQGFVHWPKSRLGGGRLHLHALLGFSMLRAIVTVVLVGMGVSLVALKFFPVPYCWIGLTWAALGFAIAAKVSSFAQYPLMIAASVFLALALGEAFIAITGTGLPDISISTAPFTDGPDPLLGWKLEESRVSRSIEKIGGAVIYDVSYSIDLLGHRISPPDRGDKVQGCVLFLADSFPFGMGVSDQETFPYQVGLKTHGRFRVVNLSVTGYGAEHMLATMERGDLAAHPPCKPTHIFYVALPSHVLRAAGKQTFSIYGPRYQLGPNGVPEYLGTQQRPPKWQRWRERLADQLSKSQIYRILPERAGTTEGDVELYFAIVKEAFSRFEHQWPKAELHVIVWDLRDSYANGQARFHSGFETMRTQIHFIDDILPGYTKNPVRYQLHRFDRHPNPMAHEMVASYLAERVLSPTLSVNR